MTGDEGWGTALLQQIQTHVVTSSTTLPIGTITASTVNHTAGTWSLVSSQSAQAATVANTYIWTIWQDQVRSRYDYANLREATPEQVQAAQQREAAEVARWRQREAARKQAVDAAARRAEDLLRRHLTPEQAEDLEKKNCFYLETIGKDGKRRKYRIDRGTHGNVKLLDPAGRIKGSFCVQPNGVPAADAMLAQKLWLETDEEAFRKVANYTAHV